MKNIANHRDIDKRLRKLSWLSTEGAPQKISAYAAYGDPNVRYELTQLDTFENVEVIDENGKMKTVRMHHFRIEKLLLNEQRVRLTEEPLGRDAAMRLSEKDYLLRHRNFMLTWDETSWKSRWASGLSGKILAKLQLGTILTANYKNNPTVRVELIAAKPNGYALRAKFRDNSELPIRDSKALDVFYDLGDLASRLDLFQETVNAAFKDLMVEKQLKHAGQFNQPLQKSATHRASPPKRRPSAPNKGPFQWPER